MNNKLEQKLYHDLIRKSNYVLLYLLCRYRHNSRSEVIHNSQNGHNLLKKACKVNKMW